MGYKLLIPILLTLSVPGQGSMEPDRFELVPGFQHFLSRCETFLSTGLIHSDHRSPVRVTGTIFFKFQCPEILFEITHSRWLRILIIVIVVFINSTICF